MAMPAEQVLLAESGSTPHGQDAAEVPAEAGKQQPTSHDQRDNSSSHSGAVGSSSTTTASSQTSSTDVPEEVPRGRGGDEAAGEAPQPEQPKQPSTGEVPEPPVPGGPLYQCAICGDVVYESQLDHHMLICPDPKERASPVHTKDVRAPSQAPAGTPQVEEGPPSPLLPVGPPASSAVASPAERPPVTGGGYGYGTGGKSGKQWKDGDPAQHHEAQTQRSSQRRAKTAEEQRKREDEECTFRPKVTPRRQAAPSPSHPSSSSTAASSRSASTGNTEPVLSQRWGDRSHRLRRVEAQAYANLTLKPEISRFAKVWSQRQSQERQGQQPTVWDRLYHAALQAQASQQAMQEERSRSIPDKECLLQVDLDQRPKQLLSRQRLAESLGQSSMGQKPHSTRRIPTSELLYSDALDRRERLKAMAEQLQNHAEELAREKRQVSGRSRRYYWQMLERQIKAAFDVAAKGDTTLGSEQLEDFLVNFGCARGRREAREPRDSQAPEEETSRLHTALWRHLDPQNTGFTDLLTLTVFFHVLMGAVDEAARASQNLASASASFASNQHEDSGGTSLLPSEGQAATPLECPAASPATTAAAVAAAASTGTPAVAGGGIVSGGGVAPQMTISLSAISEEDGISAEDQEVSVEDLQDGVRGRSALLDDREGRRIVDLLLRFDPSRLRCEFQSLYLHRLHYQSLQCSATQERPGEQVVAPEIDSQSRLLAARLLEREKGECKAKLSSHVDVLLWRHSQAQVKKQEKILQARHEEVSRCTFKPRCSPPMCDLQGEVVTPRGVTRTEVLYARAVADRERRERRVQEDARARSDAEVRSCTFRPDTGKSNQSYHRAVDCVTPMPRGFYETRQRLRDAGEVERQKRQQKEDRLARPTPMSHRHHSTSAASRALDSGMSAGVSASAAGASVGSLEPAPGSSTSVPMPPPTNSRRPVHEQYPGHLHEGSSSSTSPSPRGCIQDATQARGQRSHSQPPALQHQEGLGWQLPPGILPPPHEGSGSPRGSAVTGSSSRVGSPSVPASSRGRGSPRVAFSPRGGGRVSIADSATSEASKLSAADHESLPAPLLYVDVNIAPGKPPERIVLREGQSVNEVAADFAARHALPPVLAQRLHALLKEVLQRQEQHLSHQRPK